MPAIWTSRHPTKRHRRRVEGWVELRFGWARAGAADGTADDGADDAFMAARDLRAILEQLAAWSVRHGVEWDVLFPAGFKTGRVAGVVDEASWAMMRAWAAEGGSTANDDVDDERAERVLAAHQRRYEDLDPAAFPGLRAAGLTAQRRRAVLGLVDVEREAESVALEIAARKTRGDGELRLGWWRASFAAESVVEVDVRSLADRGLVELELNPLGDRWVELGRTDGEALVDRWLRFDGAFGLDDAELTAQAARFWASVGPEAQLLANGRWDPASEFVPVGGYGFDAALAVVVPGPRQARVGIFWIGVED